MTTVILIFVIIAGVLCVIDTRAGFYLSLLTGFLQDPIRKLVPDQPVYLSAAVGIMVALTFIGAATRGVPLSARPVFAVDPRVKTPLTIFVVVVLMQAVSAVAVTKSVVVGAIGLVAYLGPLPVMLLGYHFFSDTKAFVRFLSVYVGLSAVMLFGVYLSTFDVDWDILGSVGEPLLIYGDDGVSQLPAGFMRAPEIAAWHAAASICIVAILGVSARTLATRWLCGLGGLYFFGALFLTGRRKFILEIVMFACVYLILMTTRKRGSIAPALVALGLATGGILVAWQTGIFSEKDLARFRPTAERSVTFSDNPLERILNNSVYSFQYVVQDNGFWGSGAGSASQGAQHFGGGDELVGVSAEGGLAKVLAELGVPGFAVFLWLAFTIAGYTWIVMKYVREADLARAKLTYGVAAFIAANVVVFVTAHQAYGDMFVLIMLGWMGSFIIATTRGRVEAKSVTADALRFSRGTSALPAARRELAAPRRWT